MNELDRIIARLEQQRAALDRALSALRQVSGSDGNSWAAPAQPEAAVTKKGGITPAGRRKLSEASRMRWAQKRAAQAGEELGPVWSGSSKGRLQRRFGTPKRAASIAAWRQPSR